LPRPPDRFVRAVGEDEVTASPQVKATMTVQGEMP